MYFLNLHKYGDVVRTSIAVRIAAEQMCMG